jgi:hypothetical protein
MSDCNGKGYCFKRCCIGCFISNYYTTPLEKCTCNDLNSTQISNRYDIFDVYSSKEVCPKKCQLYKCHNYTICRRKLPEWVLETHDGMCAKCEITTGKLNFIHERGKCQFCLENNSVLEISPNDKVCIPCWQKINNHVPCPRRK